MGLSISHGAFRAPYSSFGKWRRELAEYVNIPLLLMDGFYYHEEPSWSKVDNKANREYYLNNGLIREDTIIPLSWEPFNDDVIVELLNHSDCDGEIEWQVLNDLANRLQEVLDGLHSDDMSDEIYGYGFSFRERTEKFIQGAREAYRLKENLEFS